MFRSLANGCYLRVRAALADGGPVADGGSVPVCWYGQHDASWVAYYDALGRLGLARYGPPLLDHFSEWADIVRSCGWWWPDEDLCVVVERPAFVRTEASPGADYGEIRLSLPLRALARGSGLRDGLTYRDGWHPLL